MTSGTVPFKEGTVPCLQSQGGLLRDQEGFCTLQNSLGRALGSGMGGEGRGGEGRGGEGR